MTASHRHVQRRASPWPMRLCRAVAVLGLSFSAAVQALTIGHSRVESAATDNVQLSVIISGVSAAEAEQLDVRIAPSEAWQALGLKPLSAVINARVDLTPGPRPDSVRVRFLGDAPVDSSVIDLLFDVRLADEQQRHQVSMLQQPRPNIQLPAQDEAATSVTNAGASSAASPSATSADRGDTITVRSGDTLHGIAQRLNTPHGSEYQLLAALYELNPQAFGQDNMHLLFAGEQLRMPTAEQIQAISDQQARHLYVTHIQRFNQYKEALARGASDQEATALLKNAASQQIEDPPAQPTPQDSVDAETAQESTTAETSTDRLRLDEADAAQAEGVSADERRAQEKALAHVSREIKSLEDEIDALSDALSRHQDDPAGSPSGANIESVQHATPSEGELTRTPHESSDTLSIEDEQAADADSQASGTKTAGADGAKAGDPSDTSPVLREGQSAAQRGGDADTSPSIRQEQKPERTLTGTNSSTSQSTDMEASWIQKHFITLMLALLAFIVVFTVWILRRANKTTVELESPDRVTDEMIQAKLQDINLDLDVPPSDESGGTGRSSQS